MQQIHRAEDLILYDEIGIVIYKIFVNSNIFQGRENDLIQGCAKFSAVHTCSSPTSMRYWPVYPLNGDVTYEM